MQAPQFNPTGNARGGPEFRLSDTHGILARPGVERRASSDGLGWRNALVSAQRETPFQGRYLARPSFLAVFHLSGPTRVRYEAMGRSKELLLPVGSIFLLPENTEFLIEARNTVETVHLYICQEFMDAVRGVLSSQARSWMPVEPHYEMSDPLLEQIALELAAVAARRPETDLCYVDQLIETFVMRLFVGHTFRNRPSPGGLNQNQLNRVTEYIDANLDAQMRIADLAGVAEMSPVYFARRFRMATGLAPHRYILRARVEQASRLIMATDMPLVQIALSCGFCNQEHLARSFRNWRGVTPAAYRRGILS